VLSSEALTEYMRRKLLFFHSANVLWCPVCTRHYSRHRMYHDEQEKIVLYWSLYSSLSRKIILIITKEINTKCQVSTVFTQITRRGWINARKIEARYSAVVFKVNSLKTPQPPELKQI
jgi:hypothetical protein